MYASPSRYSALGLFACRCARCCASAIAWSVSEPAAHDGAAQSAEAHSRRMSAKVFMDESERATAVAPLAPRASVGWTVGGGGRGRRTRAAGFRRIDVPAVAPAVGERNVREHLLVRMIIGVDPIAQPIVWRAVERRTRKDAD